MEFGRNHACDSPQLTVVKERLRDGHASVLIHQRIILASGELGVCDGGHRLIVMKKIQSSDDPQIHFGTGNS
jgi:hypothetical protein